MINIYQKYENLVLAWHTLITKFFSGLNENPDNPLQPVTITKLNDEIINPFTVDESNKIVFCDAIALHMNMPILTHGQTKIDSKEALDMMMTSNEFEDVHNILESELFKHDNFSEYQPKKWELRFTHLVGERNRKNIVDISSEDIDQPVMVEGTLVMRSPERSIVPKVFSYYCQVCSEKMHVLMKRWEQQKRYVIHNKCGKKLIDPKVEEYLDVWQGKIEALIEHTPNKLQPELISIEIEGNLTRPDFTNELLLGTGYRFFGVVKSKPTKDKDGYVKEILYLKIMSFTAIGSKELNILILPDEEQQIKDFLHKKDSLDIATSIFGRHVVGFEREKKIFLLSQVLMSHLNKMKKIKTPHSYIMHMLMVGNLSTGKSSLFRVFQDICNRYDTANADSTSKAGLGANTEQDEFTKQGWVIKAGLLARASGGTIFIEEYDKLRDSKELSILNTAMSEFNYSVTKAGKNRKFTCYTQIIIVANPKDKTFKKAESKLNQVTLTADMLSRFTTISILEDATTDVRKRITPKISERMDKNLEDRQENVDYKKTIDDLKKFIKIASEMEARVNTQYTVDFLKKQVELLEIAKNRISDKAGEVFDLNTRQEEHFFRVLKAVAMWHLHPIATQDDVHETWNLMQSFWHDYMVDVQKDAINPNYAGKTVEEMIHITRQREEDEKWKNLKHLSKTAKINKILEFIDYKGNGKPTSYSEVEDWAEVQLGFSKVEFEKVINNLSNSGDIFFQQRDRLLQFIRA